MKKLILILFVLIFGLSACSSINNISKDSANQNTDKEKISSDVEEGKKVEEKKEVVEEEKKVENSEGELNEEEENIDDWQNDIVNKPCNSVSEEKKSGYQVWDDCLYKDNKLVFEHNLMYEIAQNGGEEYKNFFYDRKWGEGAGEWARLEGDNNLRIFLASVGPCGGCIYTGVYLDINLSNNKIEMKFADLPVAGNAIFSPNKHYAIYKDMSKPETGITEVLLYDFYNLKDKGVIYTIPEDLSFQRCRDGCYLFEEDIKWLDNFNVELKLMKRDNSGYVYEPVKYAGDPIIIDIRKFL